MKKMKMLPAALLAFFVSLNFISCDTEPVDPVFIDNIEDQVPDTGSGSFQATIDGELFTAVQIQAVIQDGVIAIAGVNASGEAINLITTGDEADLFPDAFMTYLPDPTSELFYWNATPEGETVGVLNVTEIDPVNLTMSGTFEFTGYWNDFESDDIPPVELVNGVFTDIPYTDNVTNPGDEYFNITVGETQTEFNIISSAVSGQFLTLAANQVSPAKSVQIMLGSTLTAGTYTVGGSEVTAIAYFEGETGYTFEPAGTLTITSNENGAIEGTFSVTLYDIDDNPLQIEGEFNVEY